MAAFWVEDMMRVRGSVLSFKKPEKDDMNKLGNIAISWSSLHIYKKRALYIALHDFIQLEVLWVYSFVTQLQ